MKCLLIKHLSSYSTPGKHYILMEGDHARDIVLAVKRLGVSITVQELYDANPDVEPSHYTTGWEILIPQARLPEIIDLNPDEGVSTPREAMPSSLDAPEPTPPEGMVYVVQKGDTLAVIARQFGVTIQSILEANSFSANRLKVGQRLLIPERGQ
jgi:LysM repeat protein